MQGWIIVLIGLGGAAGSLIRYFTGQIVVKRDLPAYGGTLIVNLTGSLAIGVLIGLGLSYVSDVLYDIVAIGLLGGLTTYSTLNVQKVLSVRGNAPLRKFWLYMIATYAGGLAATAIGFAAGMWIAT